MQAAAAAAARPGSPNSRSSLPPPPRLWPPSLPQPSANSAPTKLGRKRKIDDSRCRKHRSPPPHLPPPASPSELSRLSALCPRCPCNAIPFPGLIPPPPSRRRESAGSPLSGLSPILSAAASLRPPLGEHPRLNQGSYREGRPHLHLTWSWMPSKVLPPSIAASVSKSRRGRRPWSGLCQTNRPPPHKGFNTSAYWISLYFVPFLVCFGIEKVSPRGSSRKGAGGAGLQGREGGWQRAGAESIA